VPVTAPPIVHEVLATPGEPLEPGVRGPMEARLGADLGGVRVHRDERAGRAAAAVGAAAWTVGEHVAFAPGLYDPRSSLGRRLLAHELAHAVQDEGAHVPSALPVGRESDAAEREADRAASGARTVASRRRARRGARTAVLRRTALGTILGAAAGVVVGAVAGFLIGGPVGAIVGGAMGLVGGAVAGEMATTRSRALTADEIRYAREIYLDSVDYGRIRVTRDSALAVGAPRTIGNTIHLKSTPPWNEFRGDTMDLTDEGRITLIHEMGHVWQYQNGGLAYIPQSVIAQIRAVVSGGDRGAAYDWRAQHDRGVPWHDWNPEQQAKAIEDYNRLLRIQQAGLATPEDLHVLSILLPYINRVRRREGAPVFGRRVTPAPTPGTTP
jgi:outer membrane lipoprotein SlyB